MKWLAGVLPLPLFLLLAQCSYAQDAQEVIVAGDNWCPINCGKNDAQQGYMIDVARLALKKSGYQLRYVEMPWARAVVAARAGDIHGVVGAFHGDAPDFVFPKYPLLVMSSNTLFTRVESDWQFAGLASFDGLKLGVVKGYDYGEKLNDYVARHQNDPGRISMLAGDDPSQRSIKQMLRGRIDVFAESSPVFWYAAKKLQVSQLVREAGNVGEVEKSYVAFSPRRHDTEEIVAAFEKGVLEMSRGGKLKTLANAYGLPEALLPTKY